MTKTSKAPKGKSRFLEVPGVEDGARKAQVGFMKAQAGPKMGPRWAKMGQDVRGPATGERKMAQDAEDELQDAAQDRQDAVSERLPRAKMKINPVQGRQGAWPGEMRGPALDFV